jgi:hypothetical protein
VNFLAVGARRREQESCQECQLVRQSHRRYFLLPLFVQSD